MNFVNITKSAIMFSSKETFAKFLNVSPSQRSTKNKHKLFKSHVRKIVSSRQVHFSLTMTYFSILLRFINRKVDYQLNQKLIYILHDLNNNSNQSEYFRRMNQIARKNKLTNFRILKYTD